MIALHGFLGLPQDWSDFGYDAVDLWKRVTPLEEWANSFVAEVEGQPWLLGYSMGGRLAMHAALAKPEAFGGLILVSANPGIVMESERAMRLRSDGVWARRFREDPWDEVLRDWNAQPVLKGSALERPEDAFDREALAKAMDVWSLGRQRDLRKELLSLEIPVLHVVGEEDAKFSQMMSGLELPPTQSLNVIEKAGHRVPWDQPEAFKSAVAEFREFFG